MNNNKRFLGRWIIVLLLLVIAICWLPFLLTQYSIFDFTSTGQIGDTIGGIMGPFVGILAAFLSFMAFWTQYQANEVQRSSTKDNKIEIQKQQQRYEIDRFESKWLMLFDVYRETVKSIQCAKETGKSAFKELLDELRLTYELVEYGYAQWEDRRDKQCMPTVTEFRDTLISSEKNLRSFLTETAYTFFFYGSPYFLADKTEKSSGKTVVMKQIYEIVSKIKGSISEGSARTFDEDNIIKGKASYIYRAPQLLLKGESFQLAPYFRVLFSMVNYIENVDIKGIGYKEKYGYLKLLRCQMSDEEQALLYYNSISPMGIEWNMKSENLPLSIGTMGLIAKYRLVKNLSPRYAFFGIEPKEYYYEEKKYYEKNGERFFEHDSFCTYDPKVYIENTLDGIKVSNKFK